MSDDARLQRMWFWEIIRVSTSRGDLSFDAIASNTATHNPRESRSRTRPDSFCSRANHPALGSRKIWMDVFLWIWIARLAADSREPFLLQLRVLARILADSWYRRARAPFHGWVVRRFSAVTSLRVGSTVGSSNQAHRRGGTGSCTPCSPIAPAGHLGYP